MFSRKHPYLFFILTFTAITSLVVIAVSVFSVKEKKMFISSDVVGVIEIKGTIEDSKEVLISLKELRENSKVKSILIRIDSPGGAVGPSQEIYAEVIKTRRDKKVIVSFGTVGASGAYYIASAANGIMAVSGTITGSIGVLMVYTNFKKIFDKIGLDSRVIKSVKYKDMGSPVRDMTELENDILQNFVEKLHTQFVEDIAKGRNMNILTVRELADGRIYTGKEAKALKLIDKIGNYHDAIEWAAEIGGIKGEIKTYYPQKDRTIFEKIINAETLSNISKAIFKPSNYAGFIFKPQKEFYATEFY